MIVAVDIDHTLSHAAWRDEHIAWAKESGDWDYYHGLGIEDRPAIEVIKLLIALHNNGDEIYIVTARPRKWLRQTFSWLHANGVLVEEDHLLMRDYNDYQPASETKLELTAHLKLDLLIEDNEEVAKAFAGIGVTVLLARLVS